MNSAISIHDVRGVIAQHKCINGNWQLQLTLRVGDHGETLIVLHGDAEALGVQQKPTEYVRIDDSKPTVERSNEPFEAPQA